MMPDRLLILLSIAIALTDAASIGHAGPKAMDCDSEIYCVGDLLKTVQLAEVFPDSKTFVDLHQLHDPQVTLNNFHSLMNETDNHPNQTRLMQFVNENFASTNELSNWTLSDWTESPSILKRVQDPNYREWVKKLNEIWKTLARKINDDVAKYPERYSIIYVENGFIVPGGRFKEFYYWDSYWVIEGLLLCDMYQTAKGMIDNFLYMVEKYGFIPNGGRIYYLMRSQPPLLHLMVEKYLAYTGDYDYLRTIIPLLEKEFSFWQREKMIEVEKNGKTYKLARYVVQSPRPRPESYKEDYRIAEKLPEKSREFFYNNIKAGAESGWDFSNRWYERSTLRDINANLSLQNISTEYIIPTDLNSIINLNARLLSQFHAILGNGAKSQYYAKTAAEIQQGIDNVLWKEEEGVWFDYDLMNKEPKKSFYPSNLTPLFTKSYDTSRREEYARRAVKYFKSQNIEHFFGTPTSLQHTGEQWDYPNAWPPLQSFLITGLYQTKVGEAMDLAKELAGKWLASNYEGFQDTGEMFEKYDAASPGHSGGGGEYNVQTGFGWTNGVVLEFLNTFPTLRSMDVAYDFGEVEN